MRWGLLLLAACGMQPVPKQTEFPTFRRDDTYHTRIADLRTALGRAGIGLRVAGQDATFASADCRFDEPRRAFGGCVRCELAGAATRMDGAVIEAATRVFASYPAEALAVANIDHVAICTDIVHANAGAIEHPAGTVDVRGRGLLLSVKYFLDAEYRPQADFTVDDIVHHELFHLLEHARMQGEMLDDPEWSLHNPTDFVYATAPDHGRAAGFVSTYAMTSAVEDKASVYEYVMAHASELCELARDDEVLRTKTRIIWRRVAAAFGGDDVLRAAAACVDWIE